MHLIMVEKNARQYRGAVTRIYICESSAKMERQTVCMKQERDDTLTEKYRAEWIAEEEGVKRRKREKKVEEGADEEKESFGCSQLSSCANFTP
jgi:hypothetical protein